MVRLYGQFVGYGSLAVVSRGWESALRSHGLLAGRYGLDGGHEGADVPAPAAVVTHPSLLPVAFSNAHEVLYLAYAFHTSKGATAFFAVRAVGEQRRLIVLAPSASCASYVPPGVPTQVVSHGVEPDFQPVANLAIRASHLWSEMRPRQPISLLHMAESSLARKGTMELVQAVRGLPSGLYALTIVASAMEFVRLKLLCADDPRIRVLPRLNASARKLRFFYSCFDAVVQPSRSEGFGLVPLEALCCGVPVILTRCSGHVNWARDAGATRAGVSWIALGKPQAVTNDLGLMPEVRAESIRRGIETWADRRVQHALDARGAAHDLRLKFAWESVTAAWAQQIKEKFHDRHEAV